MGQGKCWAYHDTDHFRAERYKFIPPRLDRGEVVKLHLGCGKRKYRGYVNIDNNGRGDLDCDITNLPFKPNTISEILLVHVFEHLWPWKVEEILKHWYTLLIPGGKLIMEMPDLNKILEHFKTKPLNMRLTLFALYGGEQSERVEDLHKFCWNYETLAPIMEKAGFKCEQQPARFHLPERDFIIQGTK